MEYICLEFFSENSNSFRCFQSDREFIPDPRRSDRESTFTLVKFCFRYNNNLIQSCRRSLQLGQSYYNVFLVIDDKRKTTTHHVCGVHYGKHYGAGCGVQNSNGGKFTYNITTCTTLT